MYVSTTKKKFLYIDQTGHVMLFCLTTVFILISAFLLQDA